MQPTGAVPRPLARLFAVSGLILFGGSLVFFAYQYAVTFGTVVSGDVPVRVIAGDIGLFSLFALHHSLFARDSVRSSIARSVGTLERSVYVWIASVLFIAICAWWRPIAGVAWRANQPAVAVLMTGAQLVGGWLTLRSALLIDVRELAGLRQVANSVTPLRTDPSSRVEAALPEFTTRGPYGWVRHPIYAGWFLMVFAAPVMTMTRLVFALTSCVYLLIAIPFEERSLRRSSRGAYDAYIRNVRWRLVPGVF